MQEAVRSKRKHGTILKHSPVGELTEKKVQEVIQQHLDDKIYINSAE